MLTIRKPSQWVFETSATGGVGLEFVLAEGGNIYLTDPAGTPTTFSYGAAGVGLSAGIKLPKIGKIQVKGKSVTTTIAPASFLNGGQLYVLDGAPGNDLTPQDIRGVCALVEIGGGIVAGASATAMIVGMDPTYLLGLLAFPGAALFFDYRLLSSATGLLVMGGFNVGIQAGGGGGAMVGGLW